MPHKDQEKNRYHIKINARIPQEDQDKNNIKRYLVYFLIDIVDFA